MWSITVFSNPFISADTEYVPGGIEANRYRPLLSEVALKVYPFCSSCRVTCAPCTIAPDESVSVPLTVPK